MIEQQIPPQTIMIKSTIVYKCGRKVEGSTTQRKSQDIPPK